MSTLLSRPIGLSYGLKVDVFTYGTYGAQHNKIALNKKYCRESENKIESADVGNILTEIDKNKRKIMILLKNKYYVYGKIQNMMYLKSKKKTKMTEEQIVTYKQFSDYYNNERNELNKAFDEIEDKLNLKDVQEELRKENSSYCYVYNELKTINEKQINIICELFRVIDMVHRTLSVLDSPKRILVR